MKLIIPNKELDKLKPLVLKLIQNETLPKEVSRQDLVVVEAMYKEYKEGRIELEWFGRSKQTFQTKYVIPEFPLTWWESRLKQLADYWKQFIKRIKG